VLINIIVCILDASFLFMPPFFPKATSLLDGISSITNGRFDNDYNRRANSRREDSRRDLSWREPSSRAGRSSGFMDDSSGGMMAGTAPLYASSSSSSSSLATSPWDAASAGAAAGALTSAVLVLAAEGQFTPLAQVHYINNNTVYLITTTSVEEWRRMQRP